MHAYFRPAYKIVIYCTLHDAAEKRNIEIVQSEPKKKTTTGHP